MLLIKFPAPKIHKSLLSLSSLGPGVKPEKLSGEMESESSE